MRSTTPISEGALPRARATLPAGPRRDDLVSALHLLLPERPVKERSSLGTDGRRRPGPQGSPLIPFDVISRMVGPEAVAPLGRHVAGLRLLSEASLLLRGRPSVRGAVMDLRKHNGSLRAIATGESISLLTSKVEPGVKTPKVARPHIKSRARGYNGIARTHRDLHFPWTCPLPSTRSTAPLSFWRSAPISLRSPLGSTDDTETRALCSTVPKSSPQFISSARGVPPCHGGTSLWLVFARDSAQFSLVTGRRLQVEQSRSQPGQGCTSSQSFWPTDFPKLGRCWLPSAVSRTLRRIFFASSGPAPCGLRSSNLVASCPWICNLLASAPQIKTFHRH